MTLSSAVVSVPRSRDALSAGTNHFELKRGFDVNAADGRVSLCKELTTCGCEKDYLLILVCRLAAYLGL